MTADMVFSAANGMALLGWLVLAGAVFRNNTFWRDQIAGWFWPLGMAGLYTGLVLLFFGKSTGGFDTLANVKLLFTSDWVALAGWVHYLAFDLFIGAWIARSTAERGMSRLWLVLLLPATFMFGPAGLLGFAVAAILSSPLQKDSTS